METIDLYFVLTAAFLGGIGHCIGMCGGIVVAYSSSKLAHEKRLWRQSLAHLMYNLGRVSTYIVIGIISGLLGKVIAFTPTTKGVLFVLTGFVMILASLSLLGNIKFLNSAECSVSNYPWYRRIFEVLMRKSSLSSFYLLGMLNGLIPCGLVYSFAIVAASSASPLWGGVVMAIFGIATIPALFFLGTATRFLQRGNIRNIMLKLSAVLVLLYGAFLLYKGYRFIRYPDEMAAMLEKMHRQDPLSGKCGGMKCAPGKCG